MHSVNVTELRLHLRNYLEQVQQGEEIAITLHGKTIARIVSEHQESKRETTLKRVESLRAPVIVGDTLAKSDSVWDSFFISGPAVSDDFMGERARQQQNGRESF